MSFQNIEIKPIAGRIGAKIKGVDLSANLSDDIRPRGMRETQYL